MAVKLREEATGSRTAERGIGRMREYINQIAIFRDFAEQVEPLTDEELGRLVRMMMNYVWVTEDVTPQGNERYAWASVRAALDRYIARRTNAAEKNKENALSRWGKDASRSESVRVGASRSESVQVGATLCDPLYTKQEQEQKTITTTPPTTTTTHTAIEIAARQKLGLGGGGDEVIQEIVTYCDKLADAIILHGIQEAVTNGHPNWNYTRAILNRYVDEGITTVEGAIASDRKPKQKPNQNPATNYTQRDYSAGGSLDGLEASLYEDTE